jgi:leader peptidase (prepilin peptidase)/N-methyltransferase
VSGNPDLILGSLAGGAVSFALLFVIALVSGGMGFGDVKLAAFTGIACGRFGFPVAVAALLLAFVLGGLAAIVLILMRRAGRKDALPFAPALCLGALTAMFGNLALVRAWLP